MDFTELIAPFYRPLPDNFRRAPALGQLCRVPIPRHYPIPQILDVERARANTHDSVQSKIRNITRDDFHKKNRLPVYRLRLDDHEELLINPAKLRPAIVVSLHGTEFKDVSPILKMAGKTHLQERNIVVAPIYGTQSPEHPAGFPPIMRRRVGLLMYSQFFPCPANSSPALIDGVARLDRLHPVIAQEPAWQPLPLALADDALAVLLAMIRCRFGSKSEQELDSLRELFEEDVRTELAQSSHFQPSGQSIHPS